MTWAWLAPRLRLPSVMLLEPTVIVVPTLAGGALAAASARAGVDNSAATATAQTTGRNDIRT